MRGCGSHHHLRAHATNTTSAPPNAEEHATVLKLPLVTKAFLYLLSLERKEKKISRSIKKTYI